MHGVTMKQIHCYSDLWKWEWLVKYWNFSKFKVS